MALTQTDITKLTKILITKEDLRKALAPYATKQDLEKYVAVDEFRQFKDDVLTGLDKVMGELKKIREEQIFMHNKVYQDHEKESLDLNKPKALPKSKIIVHCLVKNEERFIWYALQSVLPYVDHVLVWDTGSTDKTLDIIRSIKSSKISLKTFKSVSATLHTKLRQQMLQATPKDKYDWLMILDGDEVWPEASIKKPPVCPHPSRLRVYYRSHPQFGR